MIALKMDEKNPSRIKNSALVGISILTGIVGLIIVLGALTLGLQIGNGHEQRGIIVVCFVGASAPLSLLVMTMLALGIMKRLRKQSEVFSEDSNEEDIT